MPSFDDGDEDQKGEGGTASDDGGADDADGGEWTMRSVPMDDESTLAAQEATEAADLDEAVQLRMEATMPLDELRRRCAAAAPPLGDRRET